MAPQRPRTRLHWPGDLFEAQRHHLPRAQAAYLTRVLRLKTGAEIGLFNGAMGEWRATLAVTGARDVQVTVGAQLKGPEAATGLTLAFGTIKKTPMEWMVSKATELGVDALQPLTTDHSQADLGRPERLETLMGEAAEQSERCRVPHLAPVQPFSDWLAAVQGPLIAAVEAGQAGDIRDTVGQIERARTPHTPLTLLIGPEGGFSAGELAALRHKALCVSLGPRVLKAETAALALLTGVAIARGEFKARPDFRP